MVNAAAIATLVDDPGGLDLTTDAGVVAFLRVIRGRARTGALAASTGCSRFTVSRWLSGRGRPALGELLAYVDAATGRLAAFATALAGRRGVPSLRAHREVLEARMALAQRDPWAQVEKAMTAYRGLYFPARFTQPGGDLYGYAQALVLAAKVKR